MCQKLIPNDSNSYKNGIILCLILRYIADAIQTQSGDRGFYEPFNGMCLMYMLIMDIYPIHHICWACMDGDI